jgi:peptidyl-tRNA hydrolase, PTH1 family
MKVVVGLGNPGSQYAGTRHNVGFVAVDMLAQAPGTGRWQQRFEAEVAEGQEGDEKVLFVKPQTFMNRSGRSVRQILDFYKVPLTDLLVIADDINLPLGQLRARLDGSAGGHNGLKDIAQHLATTAYPRLRIGVGEPDGVQDLADYVLARFRPSEQPVVQDALLRAVQAAAVWMRRGMEACMNQYNNVGPKKKPAPSKPSAPEAGPKDQPSGARLP